MALLSQDLCVRVVASNFENDPTFGPLPDKLVKKVVDILPLDLPLELVGTVRAGRAAHVVAMWWPWFALYGQSPLDCAFCHCGHGYVRAQPGWVEGGEQGGGTFFSYCWAISISASPTL